MDFVLYIQEKWENVSCQYSHLFYHEYILNCSSALLESRMYWFLILFHIYLKLIHMIQLTVGTFKSQNMHKALEVVI